MNFQSTADEERGLKMVRHSCSHLLAAALRNLWPTTRFGVGPATKDGFYYDVESPVSFTPDHFPQIEEEMQRLKGENLPFQRSEMQIDTAIALMDALNQPYKVELLRLLKEKGSTSVREAIADESMISGETEIVNTVSLYKLGDFVDLCTGPHVNSTGDIPEFKLISIAGAYWRGDSSNPQLQRLYGLCFNTRKDLEHRIWQLDEMKKRDHRRIGKDLKLFSFAEEVGSGLPLWLPRGRVLRDELEHLARQTERRHGYLAVSTPQLTHDSLYFKSRHLPYYASEMYAPMEIDNQKYYLRPMNCPHHHMVFRSDVRSYRDLPLRIAEYGQVYRYEPSGALSGLMRTRGFCQNDAHIYCRFDQAKQEFLRVMQLHSYYYELFGIDKFYMRLSLPDLQKLDKYVDEPDKWRAALSIIVEAMRDSGLPYREAKGEAAFYGPKVDFMIESAVGNEFAISTNQLDFLATETFDLTYTAEDGSQQPIYVIHRAPLGSHERFVAFLIEHYGGAFPTWLSPIQIRLIPISDRHVEYARKVHDQLFDADVLTGTGGLRVDLDDSSERMQKKIRAAQLERVPYMLVVGDKEVSEHTVSVRLRDGRDLGAITIDALLQRVRQEVLEREDISAS